MLLFGLSRTDIIAAQVNRLHPFNQPPWSMNTNITQHFSAPLWTFCIRIFKRNILVLYSVQTAILSCYSVNNNYSSVLQPLL